MSGSGQLTLERLPLSTFKADPRNPRQHSNRQIKQIARSVATFGFNTPVLIDRENCVVAGHGRLAAAQLLGLTHIPAVRLEHLAPEQARAFAIADNKLTDNSTWDDKLLGVVFRDLANANLDFSLEVTGFSIGEIDLKIEDLSNISSSPTEMVEDEDNDPGPTPISKYGDCWILNDHRILCADARDRSSYETLLDGHQANMVFSDSPYNVPIQGHVSGLGSARHREFAMASGEMSPSQFIEFLSTIAGHLTKFSVNGSIHFLCMDWRHIAEIMTAGLQSYSEFKNLCVWVKNNAGMGSFYRSQHELVFVFKNGKAVHRNNFELGQHGRYRTNVWSYPAANTFSRAGDEGNLLALHPTVKPVAMVVDAILDCSERGDAILDPFLGSGSTLIAAERVKRHCYGVEIDPRYLDVAIRRWQKHCGSQAVHRDNGKNFQRTCHPGGRPIVTCPIKGDHKVGYGRPPISTQFKPGMSGNPRGRRKLSPNFIALVDAELKAKLFVTENVSRRKISKRAAIVKQLINKSASGDLKALNALTNLMKVNSAAEFTRLPEPKVPGILDGIDLSTLTDKELQDLYMRVAGETR